jgi:hypothetical protein
MEDTGANCHISSQSLNFSYAQDQRKDSSKNLPQMNNFTLNKRETSKKWGNTIQHTSGKKSCDMNPFSMNKPLDLSHYKTSLKSDQNLVKNGKLSESSTYESTKTYESSKHGNTALKHQLLKESHSMISNKINHTNNLYDSLLEERKNSNDTFVSDFGNALVINEMVKSSLASAVENSVLNVRYIYIYILNPN